MIEEARQAADEGEDAGCITGTVDAKAFGPIRIGSGRVAGDA